jgi:hypothetical protein
METDCFKNSTQLSSKFVHLRGGTRTAVQALDQLVWAASSACNKAYLTCELG